MRDSLALTCPSSLPTPLTRPFASLHSTQSPSVNLKRKKLEFLFIVIFLHARGLHRVKRGGTMSLLTLSTLFHAQPTVSY